MEALVRSMQKYVCLNAWVEVPDVFNDEYLLQLVHMCHKRRAVKSPLFLNLFVWLQ